MNNVNPQDINFYLQSKNQKSESATYTKLTLYNLHYPYL